jgi:hypothetical protein
VKRSRTVALGLAVVAVTAAGTGIAAPRAQALAVDLLVPLIFQTSTPTNYAAFDDDLRGAGTYPLDEAKRKAAWVHIDALSEPTHLIFADGSCLTNIPDGASQRAAKRPCQTGDASNQMWTIGPLSLTIASPIVTGSPAVTYALPTSAGFAMRPAGAEYTKYAGAANVTRPLLAQVGVDETTRSAELSGRARPNSTVIFGGDDTRRAPVSSDGFWTYTFSGLPGGRSTITVDEYAGAVKSASTTVEVTLGVPTQALTVDSPADPAVGYAANAAFTFGGMANPKVQTVHIENFAGTSVADVPIDPSTGAWSWTRANMGTSIWKLRFYTMKGTALQESVVLGDFAPKP